MTGKKACRKAMVRRLSAQVAYLTAIQGCLDPTLVAAARAEVDEARALELAEVRWVGDVLAERLAYRLAAPPVAGPDILPRPQGDTR